VSINTKFVMYLYIYIMLSIFNSDKIGMSCENFKKNSLTLFAKAGRYSLSVRTMETDVQTVGLLWHTISIFRLTRPDHGD
jgi:hypothetical protein